MNLQTFVTTTSISSHINTPMAVALVFAFAGSVFLGIYLLRRIRGEIATPATPETR